MSTQPPLDQALGAILQDPAQLQKIFALAQSLGLSSPPQPPPSEPPPALPQPPPPAPERSAAADTLAELLQKAGKLDRRQENLLNALKPFLKPGRREKIDRAMQAARLSRLAGAALRGRDPQDPEKR